jgi:DNA primase
MAGRIPEKFIEDLLGRVDIVDVIDARVPLKKAGKDYKACCPFHEEKTPSFTVSADKQFYHCFGCGEHGTAIGFLMRYDRMSFPEAVRELAARAGIPVPEDVSAVDDAAGRRNQDLLGLLEQASQFYRRQLKDHPEAPRAVEYLKGRGLSGEIAAEFGLGYAPSVWDSLLKALGHDEPTREAMTEAGLLVRKDGGGYYDRFRGRVIFPIHDYRGRIVGFGGRVIGEGEPKYLNSPETPVFHKGREVYGLYRARDAIRREERVLVVEGYMDVVALAQFGIDYAVATLGTATTRDHLDRLFRHAPEVVFAFDGDRAGRAAAWRALENVLPVMQQGRQVSFLFLPEGEDPDSMVRKEGAEAFGRRIREARPLGEYMLESLTEQVDLGRMDGQARLAELARPLIEKLPAGIFRDLLVEQLAKKTRVNAENLSKLLGNPRPTASIEGKSSGRSQQAGPPQPTLMRKAIALVLQHPGLVQNFPDRDAIGQLTQPGAELLQQLVEVLDRHPNLSTAQLLERFRDAEVYPHLGRLASWQDAADERPDEERDRQAEFNDVVRRLRREAVIRRIDELGQKGLGMTDQERDEFKRLSRERAALDKV